MYALYTGKKEELSTAYASGVGSNRSSLSTLHNSRFQSMQWRKPLRYLHAKQNRAPLSQTTREEQEAA